MTQALDFDSCLESSWGEFSAELTQHLKRLESGERMVIATTDCSDPVDRSLEPEARPWMSIARDGRLLTVQVPSNAALDPRHRLSPEAMTALRRKGFTRDGKVYTGSWLRESRAQLAELLAFVVHELFGVVHPSFLTLGEDLPLRAGRFEIAHWEPVATTGGRAGVLAAMQDALGDLDVVHPREEGGFTLDCVAGPCTAMVDEHATAIWICCALFELDDILREGIHERVNDLNERLVGARVVIRGDNVVAMTTVPTNPLPLGQLRRSVLAFLHLMDAYGMELVEALLLTDC